MTPRALAPLQQHPAFRLLWFTSLTANVCMWMNDVAAAWLMTTLTTSPVMVAIVQTASLLPVFLLGLPSGALADMLDRRRCFLFTQVWVALVAIVGSVSLGLGAMTAPWLLMLTMANGVGLAMRMPVMAALVPELVSRSNLSAALTLNAVSMNMSRIIGPLVAGMLIAGAGTAWVFALNGLLSVLAALVVMRWKRPPQDHAAPAERLLAAIGAGLTYVRHSPYMPGVMLRSSMFFFQASAVMALLPLVARQLHGGNAGTFTMLLALLGAGAVSAAFALPRLRQAVRFQHLVAVATAVLAGATIVVALAPSAWIAALAMFCAGTVWITIGNTLAISAQATLPNRIRARGMSIYQMSSMGSSALGAAFWGYVASHTSVRDAMLLAGVAGFAMAWFGRRLATEPNDMTESNS